MTASGPRRQAGVALWVAAWLVGGCSVERVTAVESADSATDDGGGAGSGEASIDGMGSGEAGSSSSGGESGIPTSACSTANAACTTSDPQQGQCSIDGYFIRNDAWNTDAGPGPQTLSACSYSSWNVVAKEPSTIDVKAYPDVQMDFQASGAGDGTGIPISSFKSITSTFAETSPHVGLYEYAYDMFLNSDTINGPGTTEIMIWVDIYGNRVPSGSKVLTAVSLDTQNYDVYYEPDNGNGGHYIVFVANKNVTSGTVDILAFFNYAIGKNWLPAAAPLNQICFGVEICETNGGNETFQFTNFSITAPPN